MKKELMQNYELYTPEDFQVWSILFNRQFEKLESVASFEYIEGLRKINFTSRKIPDFKETNQILNSLTGWGLTVVPNIIPGEDFFPMLLNRKFPATTWLRTMQQLDYLEEPDMFHDVFGHVPLLTNKDFCDFFQGLGKIACDHGNSPEVLDLLGKIYWFTIEFGLIKENNELKIYGAGILSSPGETHHSLSHNSLKKKYDVETIFNTSYRTDIFQEVYFVIDSFKQLLGSLPAIQHAVKERMKMASNTITA